jgi:pyoverdine/dityrosine biosynthesis protein Dit1
MPHALPFPARRREAPPDVTASATALLDELFRFRRTPAATAPCAGVGCPACLAPHLPRVEAAIAHGRPLTFVLPAFPGKSPNPAKVLGPLPDHGEQLALEFLDALAARLAALHAPGVRFLLCSDGRVFSDVVGMRDEDVTAYQQDLSQRIAASGLRHLALFSLDHLHEGEDFAAVRQGLMARHGAPLDALRERVRRGGQGSEDPADREAHRVHCGMTRFLLEDASHPGQTLSRNALQRACRARAYELVRRSNAWSDMLATCFPEAVRLSIHPQGCGATKLGLQLLTPDTWMTPWHGVAVETATGVVLMKRAQAEAAGARLVLDGAGRGSHFRLETAWEVTPCA